MEEKCCIYHLLCSSWWVGEYSLNELGIGFLHDFSEVYLWVDLFEFLRRIISMQLKELIDEIKFPGVDVVEIEDIVFVILEHGLKELGVAS